MRLEHRQPLVFNASVIPCWVLESAQLRHTIELARAHGLTFYDACYLALAVARNTLLVTADSKMLDRLPKSAPAQALIPEAAN